MMRWGFWGIFFCKTAMQTFPLVTNNSHNQQAGVAAGRNHKEDDKRKWLEKDGGGMFFNTNLFMSEFSCVSYLIQTPQL